MRLNHSFLSTFLTLYAALINTNANANANAETTSTSTKIIAEEEHEIGYIQSLKLQIPPLESVTSEFQQIEIYESKHYGKVFVLDECLQLTEKDAPHYNEMLAHIPIMEYIIMSMNMKKQKRIGSETQTETRMDMKPLKVLVIGGGDGYVVAELLKHSFVESIDHVELDQGVIDVSSDHFPWAKDLWKNEKVHLHIEDGAKFVQQKANALSESESYGYDIIIQDSSDPFFYEDDGSLTILPSNVLYSDQHFQALFQLLQPNDGILMFQAETYNIPSNLEVIKEWRGTLDNIGFRNARYGTISIPTYPTGQIGFYVANARAADANADTEYTIDDKSSDGRTCIGNHSSSLLASEEFDMKTVTKYFEQMIGKTKYYHPKIHRSAFDLPLWVEEYIY